jgi:hypothetical protein
LGGTQRSTESDTSFEESITAMNYTMIEGGYWDDPNWDWGSTLYHLRNTSLSGDITLGKVYVMGEEGIDGGYTVRTALEDSIIPPLGSTGFNLSQTGVALGSRLTGFLVVVLWEGPNATFELTGEVTSGMYGSDPYSRYHIESY